MLLSAESSQLWATTMSTGTSFRSVNPVRPGPRLPRSPNIWTMDMFCSVASLARMNVPILTENYHVRGKRKRPEIWSVPWGKNASNLLLAETPHQTLLEKITTVLRIASSAGEGDFPSSLPTPLDAHLWCLILGAHRALSQSSFGAPTLTTDWRPDSTKISSLTWLSTECTKSNTTW